MNFSSISIFKILFSINEIFEFLHLFPSFEKHVICSSLFIFSLKKILTFGGFLDCNENSLNAIKREIKEEISLTNLKNLRFVDIFIERKNENIINHVFTCIIKNNKNIKLNEGIEYSFFTKREFFRGFKY